MARVLIPLAQGCEELEAVTLIDLLRRAGIEVVVAGLQEGPVKASRGTVLLPDTSLDAVLDQELDMLVLPGGLPGADYLDQDPRIHALLRRLAAEGRYTAAICAAPKVLANAGLLDGRAATSYPGFLDGFPQVDAVAAPVVTDGKVITSRGAGTAMDFALTLIETLAGRETRARVEQQLQREAPDPDALTIPGSGADDGLA
jgi:protein deglycase